MAFLTASSADWGFVIFLVVIVSGGVLFVELLTSFVVARHDGIKRVKRLFFFLVRDFQGEAKRALLFFAINNYAARLVLKQNHQILKFKRSSKIIKKKSEENSLIILHT